jgi:hypothetical protein
MVERENIFWQSGNGWKMPTKPMEIDLHVFNTYNYFLNTTPDFAVIIWKTLNDENKAETYWLDKHIHGYKVVSPKLLPNTYLERYWHLRSTSPLQWYLDEGEKVKYLMGKIMREGYQEQLPIWLVAKWFQWEEPPQWFVVLDGGQHRLQAVRELQAGRESKVMSLSKAELPADFKIPCLISIDMDDARKLPEFKLIDGEIKRERVRDAFGGSR